MQNRYNFMLNMIETELKRSFQGELPQQKLLQSMRYSLLAGGKRIRPVLSLEFCRISGGDMEKALPLAAAIEMIHTYTLIHDDLPSMDNDDLRRGKPTNHKIYGESTAILAGDALQAAAFRNVLSCAIEDSTARRAAMVLAEAAGERGVCGGQVLDLEAEGRNLTEDEIFTTYSLKTAALIKAAAVMGAITGGASETQIEAAGIFGENLGLAFQIRDDILDVTAIEEETGKTVGSDKESKKSTLLQLYGLRRCEELVEEKTALGIKALESEFNDTEFLIWLSNWLTKRTR